MKPVGRRLDPDIQPYEKQTRYTLPLSSFHNHIINGRLPFELAEEWFAGLYALGLADLASGSR